MIRLTQRGNGAHFYVAPEAIKSAGSYIGDGMVTDADGVRVGAKVPIFYVRYDGDGGDLVEIQEPPEDVARLRAAWECRYNARGMRGTLPMAVYMQNDVHVPEGASIQFICCAITARLKAERESKSFLAKLRKVF